LDVLQEDKRKLEKAQIDRRLKDIEDTMLKTKIPALYDKLEHEWAELEAQKKVIEEDLKNSLFVEEELFDLSNKLR
jgi:hypothetical protein